MSDEILNNRNSPYRKRRRSPLSLAIVLVALVGCYRPIITPKHIPENLIAPHVDNAKSVDLSRLSGFAATNDLIEFGDVVGVTIVCRSQ